MIAPAIDKLVLGTAQFGMDYGIANSTGKPAAPVVRSILARARCAGLSMLDTAPSYGDAEATLGGLAGADGFRIMTKTPPIAAAAICREHVEAVLDAFERSLRRLRRRSVDALLVHRSEDLLAPGGERLWTALRSLKEARRAAKIGVSVYTPSVLTAIVERYPIDIVQLPYNFYDQRFEAGGVIAGLKERGIEVHARSLFLQGLLLLPPERLAGRFAGLRAHQARLHASLAARGVSVLAGALALAVSDPGIDGVVVGCDSLEQLDEILAAAAAARPLPDARQFALSDPDIIDPSRWV